jgi:hypothetical protein
LYHAVTQNEPSACCVGIFPAAQSLTETGSENDHQLIHAFVAPDILTTSTSLALGEE